jgi:hypothetical protein
MRRAQALVLVLALLSAPSSLLARASGGMGSDCNNMCCLIHGRHAAHLPAHAADSAEKDMACHHGEAGHAIKCFMNAGQHRMDYGFLAPIAPTAPSTIVRVALPTPSRATLVQSIEFLSSGFIQAPFEPPRS